MEDSKKEKYIGDIIGNSGKIEAQLKKEKKVYGIVSEILAILEENHIVKHRMEIGLQLRQAMLLNGMLFNSEAWHSPNEIKIFESVDEHLVKRISPA